MSDTSLRAEYVLKLRQPLQLGDLEPVTELHLREPTLDELIAAGSGPSAAVEKLLIAAISAQPPALIGKMGVRDYADASRFLARLLDPVPETGTSSSPT